MKAERRTRVEREAQALAERVLREGGDLAVEYPLVFGPAASGRLVAIEMEGGVRSTCAVLVRELVFGDTRLRVGLIGSVATDEAWRGRGLASRVLVEAEAWLVRQGAALALLWADEPGFYAARGWCELGEERDWRLDQGALARLPRSTSIRRAAPDDAGAIHRAYLRHHERVERTARETAQLLRAPNMEVLVVQRERDITAYSCLGRGADFARTVHEWGGSSEDVAALLCAHGDRALARGEAPDVCLIAPPTALRLFEFLRAAGARESVGILALAKLLDEAPFVDLLASVVRPDGQVEVESVRESPTAVTLTGPAGRLLVGRDQWLRLFFPPRGDRTTIEQLSRATGLSLARLPQAPFLWGLDSI